MKLKNSINSLIFLCIIICHLNISSQSNLKNENNTRKIHINNNLSLIYHKDNSSEITILQILIKGGKKTASESQRGLSYLTTRLTLEIQSRSELKKLMTFGSIFSCFVFGDYSLITIKSLTKNFKESLDIFLTNFTKPLYSSLRINLIKTSMKFKQKIEEDDPLKLMFLTHSNVFFKNSGYDGSIYGTKESLKSIKTKNIKNFYKKYFNTSNIIISISSDLNEIEIRKIFEKISKKLQTGNPIKFNPIAFSPLNKNKHFFEKDKKQTLISFAILLPKISPENFTLAIMLEDLLGKGIGSKLWHLRAKYNLAYSFNANVSYLKNGGILSVYLKTANKKREKAYVALKDIISDLHKNGITEEELKKTKVHKNADFIRINETKENRSFSLVYFEAIGLGYDFFEKLSDNVNAVTIGKFNSYVKKIFNPENIIEVIIGPEEITPY